MLAMIHERLHGGGANVSPTPVVASRSIPNLSSAWHGRSMISCNLLFFEKGEEEHMKDREGTPGDEFYTSSGAARFIEKSEGSVRMYAATGKLPCIRTSTGLRLFRRADLEKFVSEQRAERA